MYRSQAHLHHVNMKISEEPMMVLTPERNNDKNSQSKKKKSSLTSWFLEKLAPRAESIPRQKTESVKPRTKKVLGTSPDLETLLNPSGLKRSGQTPQPEPVNMDSVDSLDSGENSLARLSQMLKQWIWLKTKVDVVLVGPAGSGKSFLANTLMQTTAQNAPISIGDERFEDFYVVHNPRHLEPSSLDLLTPTPNHPLFSASGPLFSISNPSSGFVTPPTPVPTQFDEIFEPNSEFEESIKWGNEQIAALNMREYVSTGVFNRTVADRYSYILPQGPFSGLGSKQFTIVYGKVPELVVKFYDETTVRTNLWKLHELSYISTPDMASDFEDLLRRQYRQILELSRDIQQIPLPLTSPAQLPIPLHICQLLGRTHQYRATGSNPHLDRIFVREKLLELSTRFPFIIDKIVIKVPCGLLNGEKQLVLFDSDVIDPNMRSRMLSTIGGANLVLVTVDSSSVSLDLLDMLKKSGILEKMIWNPDQHKVIFVDVTAEQRIVGLPNSLSPLLSFPSNDLVEQLRLQIFAQVKSLLLSSQHLSLNSLPNLEQKIHSSIFLFILRPLLYASLELTSGSSITSTLHQTNIPVLLSAIQNIHISSNSGSLTDFDEQLRSHSKTVQQKLNTTPPPPSTPIDSNQRSEPSIFEGISTTFLKMLNKPSSRPEISQQQLMTNFHTTWKQWKHEWTKAQQSLYNFLHQKAQETNEQMTASQLAFENFVDFVPIYWEKLVIEKVPQRTEDMISCAFQLLNDSNHNVVLQQGDQKEKLRLKQILKFCKGSAERIIRTKMQMLHHRVMSIDIPALINTTCIESREVVQINLKAYPRISEQAVLKIYESFSGCLVFAVEVVQSIQQHIQDCVRCLLDSPQMRASQIMNFLVSSQMKQLHETQSVKPSQPSVRLDKMLLISEPATQPVEPVGPMPFDLQLWEQALIGRNTNEELYKSQLAHDNWTPYDPENDLNNHFRCLASLIYNTEEAHSITRLLLMNEMLSHPQIYSPLVFVPFDHYVYDKSKDNRPADPAILLAFCNFYHTNLLLYSPLFAQPMLLEASSPQSQTLALGVLSKSQWQVLYKDESHNTLPQINIEDELRRLKQLHISDALPTDSESTTIEPSYQRVTTIRPLKDLCLETIVRYIDFLPHLQGSVPEDLTRLMIQSCLAEEKISLELLDKILDESMGYLCLSGWKGISGLASQLIGQRCPSLRHLDLSKCRNMNSQDLFAILAGKQCLETLNLEGCVSLDNQALEALSCCISLVEINLTGCSGLSFPQPMFHVFPKVKRLTLRGLGNLALTAFQGFSSALETLDLSDCPQLPEELLFSIGSFCKSLVVLKLSGPAVSDRVVEAFCKSSWTSLQQVELSYCEISGKALEQLAISCPSLEELVLHSCRSLNSQDFGLIGSSLYAMTGSNLYAMNRLRRLDLSRCLNVSSESLASFGNCRDLSVLSLASCDELHEQTLTFFVRQLSHLSDVNLSDCVNGVTDSVVAVLAAHSPHLKKLSLYNCHKISDKSLLSLASHCPSLSDLNVNSCENISDYGLKQLALGCSGLRSLLMEECNVSDVGIRSLARGCPDLETISLAYCKAVTSQSVDLLSQFCPLVVSFDMSYLKQCSIDDQTNHLLQRWHRLRQFSCRGDTKVTDQPIIHPTLQMINLSWNRNLTDLAVIKTAQACPSLTALDLAWCSMLSTNAIHNLAQAAPNLVFLNIRGCDKISKLMIKYISGPSKTILV